jgi:hypothetical protein
MPGSLHRPDDVLQQAGWRTDTEVGTILMKGGRYPRAESAGAYRRLPAWPHRR